MCGRFAQYGPRTAWEEYWPADWRVKDWTPRYNVAPATSSLAITPIGADRERAELLLWGLERGRRLWINARLETLEAGAAFRPLLERGRVIIPMNGYFEWDAATRQPHYITAVHAMPLWALGLYEPGQGMVIVTRPASEGLLRLHPRMPALANHEEAKAWLHESPSRLLAWMATWQGLPDDRLTYWPVSTRVNHPRHQGPDLIQRQVQPAQGAFEW
ncbi:MAG: SOS response-associated peptidase [Firmicutes bacterium]|nr:SOS response-associated peptidase [Bacillota bacterium]